MLAGRLPGGGLAGGFGGSGRPSPPRSGASGRLRPAGWREFPPRGPGRAGFPRPVLRGSRLHNFPSEAQNPPTAGFASTWACRTQIQGSGVRILRVETSRADPAGGLVRALRAGGSSTVGSGEAAEDRGGAGAESRGPPRKRGLGCHGVRPAGSACPPRHGRWSSDLVQTCT